MKELLEQLASYNLWANEKLVHFLDQLPEELLVQTVPSSFNSLHATLLHMWDAESIWWQRLKLSENITVPSEKFVGDTRDVALSLLQQNLLWKNWVIAARVAAIEHVFLYRNLRQEQFKQPVWQVLTHVFNHGSYHRGQIVTILRTLNIEKIPQTDFIVWCRNKK